MHRSLPFIAAGLLALPAVSQGALWSLQYSGLDTVYDGDRFYSDLGIPVSAGGPGTLTDVNRATVSDAALNGDQSFGDWNEGSDILNGQLEVFRDGVFYDTLSNVRVDTRLVLQDGESLDFTTVGVYNIDAQYSFFDLFFDQEPSDCNPANGFACTTGAWGIALDTDTNISQLLLNVLANSTIATLTGTIFLDNPGAFDLPATTDSGLAFGSAIFGVEDTFTFNLSTTITSFSGNLASGAFTGLSSGEVSFNAVPEPQALALIGLGLIGMVGIRKLRKQ
jgi:hypothetical protein